MSSRPQTNTTRNSEALKNHRRIVSRDPYLKSTFDIYRQAPAVHGVLAITMHSMFPWCTNRLLCRRSSACRHPRLHCIQKDQRRHARTHRDWSRCAELRNRKCYRHLHRRRLCSACYVWAADTNADSAKRVAKISLQQCLRALADFRPPIVV